MVAAAIATFLLTFAYDYPTFLLAALGVGIAGGSFAVGIADVSKWYPKERQGTARGIFGAGNVGAAVTKFLAPVIMVAFGWKTRTPDAHFMAEARYRGTKVVTVTPDYFEASKFADFWLHPKQGTDAALALAMGHVILSEWHAKGRGDYFLDYCRRYSDLPMLVLPAERDGRVVADRQLRASDLADDMGHPVPRRAGATPQDHLLADLVGAGERGGLLQCGLYQRA